MTINKSGSHTKSKPDPLIQQVEDEGDVEIEIRIQKLKNSKDQGKTSTILYFALVGG